MRLGEILLESKLVSAKQLSDALEYSTAKRIFLGRAMTLLEYLQEEDVARALHAQRLLKLGFSTATVVEVLQSAVREAISVERALQNRNVPRLPTGELEKTNRSLVELRRDESPQALIRYAENLLLQDSRVEAEANFRKALTLLEASLGQEHIDLVPVLVRLGNTYLALKDFDQALASYERVLSLRTRFLPDNHPEIAQTFESLGDLYRAQGDEARAMWAFLSSLDVLEKNLPSQLVAYALVLRKLTKFMHRPPIGTSIPVGEILKSAGLISAKELQTALRMSTRSALPLGVVLRENGMILDQALQSALKAQFCIRQGVLPEMLAINLLFRSCRRGVSLDRLLDEAGILVDSSDKLDVYKQIASSLDQLVASETSDVNAQVSVAPLACKLGALYLQVGDNARAEVYYSRALASWTGVPAGSLEVASACTALAQVLKGQKRHEEVLALLRTALEHKQKALGKNHEQTLTAMEDIAEAEIDYGNARDAVALVQQAMKHRESLGHDGIVLLRSVVLMGDCMKQLKNYESAQSSYKRAMTLAKPKSGNPTPALATVMEKLGDLYAEQKLLKVATPLYTSALLILEAAGKRDTEGFSALQAKISLLQDGYDLE